MPGAIEGGSVQLSGGPRLLVARRRRDAARAVRDRAGGRGHRHGAHQVGAAAPSPGMGSLVEAV